MRYYPWIHWIIGSLIFLVGVCLLILILSGRAGAKGLENFKTTYWWQYVLDLIIILLGFLILLFGFYKKIILNQNTDQFIKISENLCCRSVVEARTLHDAIGAKILRISKKNVNVQSEIYRILMILRPTKTIKLFDTANLQKARRTVYLICHFLKGNANEKDYEVIHNENIEDFNIVTE